MAAVWLILAAVLLGDGLLALLAWESRRETARAPDQEDRPREEKGPDPVGEGFENLMRYSVRGRTGLEREDDDGEDE